MFLISTTLYTALTILFAPALIVMAYMMVKNYKYKNVINVYGISNSGVSGLFMLAIIGYIFLTGMCVGDLPSVWKSTVFLACFAGSIVIAFFICKILNFINRDKIKYGNIILADEEIQNKILSCSKQMQELKETMRTTMHFDGTGSIGREITENRIKEIQNAIIKLTQIHQELQEQKIVMNAALGTKDVSNLSLSDSTHLNRSLDKEIDRFHFNKTINSNYRGVEDIMKKYKI